MQENKDLFITNLIYFILITLFCIVRLVWASGCLDFLGDSSEYVFTVIVQIGLMVLVPLFLFSLFKKQKIKQTFKDFSFKRVNFKSILLSFAIGIIVFILNIFVASFFNFILSMIGYEPVSSSRVITATWGTLFLEIFMVAVLPGFCEEFAHRGLLLKGYYGLGFKRAVIYSAILFGLMHMNVGQFFYASVIGLVLGSVTLLTGSIFPAMIIHFMNNFLNKYLSFADPMNLPLGGFYDFLNGFLSNTNPILAIFIVCVVFLALIALLLTCIYHLFKINALGSIRQFADKMNSLKLREIVLDGVDEEFPELTKEVEELSPSEKPDTRVPIELLGIPMEPLKKPSPLENIFFHSSIFLGAIVTVFTFVWSVI